MQATEKMTKLFELRFKNTNELIVASISEIAIRKEWLSLKEDGEDMENIIANQTFISEKEWNNSMLSAIESAAN